MLAFLLFPINYGESAVNYSDNFNSNSNFIPSTINDSTSAQVGVTSEKDIGPSVEKTVIIIFDRGYKNQFTNAKPIIDKYGFKASFFVICSFVNGDGYYKLSNGNELVHKGDNAMEWDQIGQLHKEGHDIESHGMEHRDLRLLTSETARRRNSRIKEMSTGLWFKANFLPNSKQ